VVSKRAERLELDVPPERALTACRTAIESLEWELAELDEAGLQAREDAAKLSCHDWPVEIGLKVAPDGEERAAVTLAGSVPGLGPVSSRHLRASLARLEGAIRRSLA
jgi:hypothetical protein